MAPGRSDERKRLAARSALVQLPKLLWGGNPAGIGAACGWVLGAENAAAGTYRLRLKERRSQKSGRLLAVHKMGHRGNVDSPGAFSRLASLPQYHPLSDSDIRWMERRSRQMIKDDDLLVTKLSAAVLRMQSCAKADLPDVVRTVLSRDLLPAYEDATAWLITVDASLSMRYALARALLMDQEDPALLARSVGIQGGKMVFESARGLIGDTSFGMSAYTTPLLLAQSPWVLGVAAPRNGGVVVLSFGRTVPGNDGMASELLHLFHPVGTGGRVGHDPATASQHEAAIGWWARQLDVLFTEVTDPCNYRRGDESFDVRAQFETMLGLEQAFRNLQTILSADRDVHAGRLACLDTLDTLEGLKVGLDFRAMSKLSIAEKTLQEVRDAMPAAVRAVLMPKAEAAVAALRELQNGFFDSPRRTPTGVRLPNKTGVDIEHSLDDATASWIRLLRNAGHSFTVRKGENRAQRESLLMAHNAVVPTPFNALAYLYVLRLVAQPELLRDARSDGRLHAT